MNAKDYWYLFMETGAPEAYLMYTNAMRLEGKYVFDNTGNCAKSNGLQ